MLYTPICISKGPSDLHFAVNHSQVSSVLNNSEIPPQCFLQGVFNSHMLFWDYYTYMGREQYHPPITSQLLHRFLRLLHSQFWEKGTKTTLSHPPKSINQSGVFFHTDSHTLIYLWLDQSLDLRISFQPLGPLRWTASRLASRQALFEASPASAQQRPHPTSGQIAAEAGNGPEEASG